MANSSTVVALRPPFHRCIETIHRRVNVARPGGERTTPADVVGPPRQGAVAYIDAVPGRRSVVDYSLQRRAVLAEVYSGRTGLFEVCDASPYLSRAAKYHGQTTDEACPVCRKERLTLVNYVYGENLGHVAGQAKTEVELARMDAMQDEFSVYTVEVCRSCGWNHLDCSYVLGAEPAPGARKRRRAATE
jgi:uncharacterized protein DUF5318